MSEPPIVDKRATLPPGAWRSIQRLRSAIGTPIERFLHVEAASGLLLLAAAIVALVCANSPIAESYHHLWEIEVGFDVAGFGLKHSLHWWINDGLMAIFFFVVGLEIKREMVDGELATLRRASLPIMAAVGGMVVPALIFTAFNSGSAGISGWGIPMATDIAFAVGIMSLLGKRVPPALRVLLLALAIIDDVGAILVIAIFYTAELNFQALWVVGCSLALLFIMQRAGVRQVMLYVIPGAALWYGVHEFGVHATIAGVILGLLTPHKSWFGKEGFLAVADSATEDFRNRANRPHKEEDLMQPLARLGVAQREALSPIVRIQTSLHGYVAWGIMPVFALANAGVALGGLDMGDPTVVMVGVGVAVGLVVGKPLGVVLASWLAVRLGLSSLPKGVGWRGILVVGAVAGIGFTMAIFIAGLAYPNVNGLESEFHPMAKIAVLIASGVAGLFGLIVGWLTLDKQFPAEAAQSTRDAERQTQV
jgi:Na+:H+ antiporter, NhaA family